MKKEVKIYDYKESKLGIPEESDYRYTLITAATIVLFYYIIINLP
jgi:hypothetical protein